MPRLALLAAGLLALVPGPLAAQVVVTNGSFESFSGPAPTGWAYLGEPGNPSLESAVTSPFANAYYPASTRSVRLADVTPGNNRPELRQAFPAQAGVMRLSFDFYLDDPDPNHRTHRVVLGYDSGSSTTYPFNINIDQVNQVVQLIWGTNVDVAPINAQTWYQLALVYDIPGRTLSGTLTPFGGSPEAMGIVTAPRPEGLNVVVIETDGSGVPSSPMIYDNFVFAPVPEPSALPLAGLGAGAVMAWARRRPRRV